MFSPYQTSQKTRFQVLTPDPTLRQTESGSESLLALIYHDIFVPGPRRIDYKESVWLYWLVAASQLVIVACGAEKANYVG